MCIRDSINTERTKIYTDYYKTHPAEYPILKRAGCIYDWCAKHKPLVMDEDILVGSLGPCLLYTSYILQKRRIGQCAHGSYL